MSSMYDNRDQCECARQMHIIEPQKPRTNTPFPDWITLFSPRWQKLACVQIRRYQSIECDDGMKMDVDDNSWQNLEVFTFREFLHDKRTGKDLEYLIGAAGFQNSKNSASLSFCWLHPFHRGKGKLKAVWPTFKERYGDFVVDTPHTYGMQKFLASVNYTEQKTK